MLSKLIFAGLLVAATGNPFPNLHRLNPLTAGGHIVGGRKIMIEEAPHQVSLQVSGFGFCGGSIISSEWILTAAHCMSYPADWVTVRAGSAKKSGGGSLHKVAAIIKHEKFRSSPQGVPMDDVALIKLADPFILDATRQPIPLFNQDEESEGGSLATITGWGALREGGSGPDDLQLVQLPIVAKKQCNEDYGPFGGIPNGQICAAASAGGKDACQGDSGGPLTISGRQAGIVSWGLGCARPGYPGVHTEVAAYRNWIAEKTGI